MLSSAVSSKVADREGSTMSFKGNRELESGDFRISMSGILESYIFVSNSNLRFDSLLQSVPLSVPSASLISTPSYTRGNIRFFGLMSIALNDPDTLSAHRIVVDGSFDTPMELLL
ncbi:hypothetical protein ACH5RR_039498 [Cinchona calisaya]|uniref:Uncharacterized protein n=1 Tax=Cinchona calisaya TaxID=153742 RepID=A0ABD2Y150_9GENT